MIEFQSQFKEKVTWHIDYFIFRDLLHSFYGVSMDMVDGHNGDIYEVTVPNIFRDASKDAEKLENIKKSAEYEEYMGDLQVLFNDLYHQEKIKAGTYYVHVFW